MSIGQTLSRLTALARNLLVNSYFAPVSYSLQDDEQWLPTPERNVFRFAPGWYTYGWYDIDGVILRGGNVASSTTSPFFHPYDGASIASGGSGSTPSGVTVTQRIDNIFGLVQPLHMSRQLRGKKVRLTGAFEVHAGSDLATAGITIGLKCKRVKTLEFSTTPTLSGAGTLSNFDDDTVDVTSTTGAVAGDSIWIEDVGVLRITTVVSGTRLNVDVSESGNLGVLNTITGKDYEISNREQWLANKRLVIESGATVASIYDHPHHVISLSAEGTSSISTGEEVLVRAWDYLTMNRVPDPASTAFQTHLVLGREDMAADRGGAAGVTEQLFLSYLKGSFADDGVEDVILYSNVPGSTGVKYFSVEVDVPGLDPVGNDDMNQMYFVVMPTHPDDVGTMAADNEVSFHALTLSPVPESDDLTAGEDLYVNFALYAQGGGPLAFAGRPMREFMQYPIYVPFLLPLDVYMRSGRGTMESTAWNDAQMYWFENPNGGASTGGAYFKANAATTFPTPGRIYWAKQSQLPFQASIIDAAFYLEEKTDWTGSCVCQLKDRRAALDAEAGELSQFGIVAEWTLTTGAAASTTVPKKADKIDRNRSGLMWKHYSDTNGFEDGIGGGCVSSDIWFNLVVPNHADAGTERLGVRGAYIYGVYDPRLGNGFWRRTQDAT